MRLRKKVAMFLAVIMAFLAVVPFSAPETVSAAKKVAPIVLRPNKVKEVQLDGKGKKEKLLCTFTREKLSEKNERKFYRVNYCFTIDDREIFKKSWIEDGATMDYDRRQIVVTDIDKNDGRKDIFMDFYACDQESEYNNNGESDDSEREEISGKYRYQYVDGKIKVKENLEKTINSWKLPKVVTDRWDFQMQLVGVEEEKYSPYYKNGEWKYKNSKSVQKNYQITTVGDGTAKWAVCLDVDKIGYIHGTITLKLKNNKLQLKSKSLSGDILETGCSGAVDKKMTVYKTAGGKIPAFIVPAKTAVSFVSYKIVNNKVYVKVKNSNGKIGWISEKEMKCLYFDGTLHA